MRLVKKENIGIQAVYSTNVEQVGTYISNGCVINKNCVVDADYQGEIHINLFNSGNGSQPVCISPGEKIVQGILLPVKYDMPVNLGLDNLYQEETGRGAGGFGSTDA